MMNKPGAGQASFDVAIVGGGVQGVGVAQAAAAAGYSVVLIEQAELAAGTSSKSSKLIHGGLRYLQQGRLRLVREALRERRILCDIAPGLVSLNKFYIPVYRQSRYRPWQIRVALTGYALLAGLGPEAWFHTLPPDQWPNLAGLDTRELQAVFCYRDAQTDDSKLTRAVMASAVSLGAVLHDHTRMLSASADGDGYSLELEAREPVRCKVLVNAAGPWVNRVADVISPAPARLDVSLVQGSHLVLDRMLSEQCFYLEAPQDQRAVFALPWHGQTLLGTTEMEFFGDPGAVAVSPREEQYLLQVLAHYFPGYVRDGFQVTERIAGLRVLPGGGGSAFSRNREMRLATAFAGGRGYVAIYGGKLTGYRASAARILRLISRHLGRRPPRADTARLHIA